MPEEQTKVEQKFKQEEVGSFKGKSLSLPIYTTVIQKGKNNGQVYHSVIPPVEKPQLTMKDYLGAWNEEDIIEEALQDHVKKLSLAAYRSALKKGAADTQAFKDEYDKVLTSFSLVGESSRGIKGEIKELTSKLVDLAVNRFGKNKDGTLLYPNWDTDFKTVGEKLAELNQKVADLAAKKEAADSEDDDSEAEPVAA